MTASGRFNIRLLAGTTVQAYLVPGRCQGSVTYANSSGAPGCGAQSRIQNVGTCTPVQMGSSFTTDMLIPGFYTIVVHNSSSTGAQTYTLTFERQN